ncbi:MAG: OmpH family outer membrane protein [Alphaproteobacteria bacterium]|nr:OmpH family outer membrane protein [Alphaproteobacteria bacterium]
MLRTSFLGTVTAGLLGVALLAGGTPALAQSQDFFIPGQGRPGAAPAPGGAARPPGAQPAPARPPAAAQQPARAADQQQSADLDEAPLGQIPMPAVPELPALPKGTAPPVAAIGVIGLPEVMRASLAAQYADKIIGERREKLNEDAQKEQLLWRDMQQALARDRARLTPDQIRARERELQERITGAQRSFRDRNRIIQEAAQFAINQVQASLVAVIRQVSESRGINLVLHRSQVALNVNEFDISEQVAEELNKILPTVNVPADGVSPAVPPTPPAAALPPPPAIAAPAAAPANR